MEMSELIKTLSISYVIIGGTLSLLGLLFLIINSDEFSEYVKIESKQTELSSYETLLAAFIGLSSIFLAWPVVLFHWIVLSDDSY